MRVLLADASEAPPGTRTERAGRVSESESRRLNRSSSVPSIVPGRGSPVSYARTHTSRAIVKSVVGFHPITWISSLIRLVSLISTSGSEPKHEEVCVLLDASAPVPRVARWRRRRAWRPPPARPEVARESADVEAESSVGEKRVGEKQTRVRERWGHKNTLPFHTFVKYSVWSNAKCIWHFLFEIISVMSYSFLQVAFWQALL